MFVREYFGFIREYLRVSQPNKKYLILDIFVALLYKGFYLLLPLAAAAIIQNLTENNVEGSYYSILAFAVIYLLYSLALYADYKIYGFLVSDCYDNLTRRVLSKLLVADSNFSRVMSKGRIINSINGDIFEIADMPDKIAELIAGMLQIALVVVIVAFENPVLAVILVMFAVAYVGVRNRADRKLNYYHNKVKTQEDRYGSLLTQILSGLQEIKTFNMLPKLNTRLHKIQVLFTKNYVTKRHYYIVRDVDTLFILYGFRFILYVVLVLMMSMGKIEIGVLILTIGYHESLVTDIDDLIEATTAIRETSTAVERIKKILNYDVHEIDFGPLEMDDINGVIELKNVSLELGDKKILDRVNFKIPHDKVVAIVGEAGAGKTMIFNLLLRLFKPTKGKITLDGRDIYDFSKKVYTSNVSVASQKPFTFNMSIRDNLDFIDSNISHQIEACKKAGIHDFIETLPNGYNTVIREDGKNISGGQKQMISIARTILTGAEVILLDDVTTSLDSDTAKLIPKLVKELKREHTVVIITKKPELMAEADQIVVLDKGRVNAIGTHQQLLRENEIYQLLQSRKSPSKVGVFDSIEAPETRNGIEASAEKITMRNRTEAKNV